MSDNQFELNMRLDGKPLAEAITRIGESIPKHDGKLDKRGEYIVEYGCDTSGRTTMDIDEYDLQYKDHPDRVRLSPAQALSLLAWLRQEEAELQRLAKEQEQP